MTTLALTVMCMRADFKAMITLAINVNVLCHQIICQSEVGLQTCIAMDVSNLVQFFFCHPQSHCFFFPNNLFPDLY